MKKLCITLDDVIRAKSLQFGKIYKKHIDNDIDLDSIDMSKDLREAFNFESKNEYMQYLYTDYPFEIFGEAPVVEKGVDKKLNLWHINVSKNYEDLELMLANPREWNASIGFTCFFLSQIATRIREIFFPKDFAEIWDRCDIAVTADRGLLEEKPEGKISIKIETPYNKDCPADYTYESLSAFLDDEEIMDKLMS